MTFLLDTNICSAYLRRPTSLNHRFEQYSGRLALASISLAELYSWAYKQDDPSRILEAIRYLLRQEVALLDFDQKCAERCGQVRGSLLRSGIAVSHVDLMIAAVALAHDLTLVTHNTSDFRNVPDLRVVDWLAP